jgi:catechol 2,3-dioxygenase-like lactoylglutathione lyase family enzyme
MLANCTVSATLPVRDLSAAKTFYQTKLGLPCQAGSVREGYLVLAAGNSTVLVFGSTSDRKSDNTSATFAVEDLDEEMAALRRKRVQFEEYDLPHCKTVDGVADMGGHRMAWIKDPDGNVLALHEIGEIGESGDASKPRAGKSTKASAKPRSRARR